MSGPIFVKVDWNRSGVFTDALDDVTDKVRGSVTASFGRDQVTALSPTVAGRGAFALDNRTKVYSPRNTASPLFGNLKPRRPVIITRVVGATTYTVFYGHTDDTPINPDVESKTVGISLVDGLADFRGVNVTIPALYAGIRTGQAVGYVLDAAGWTGGRDIDTGATVIPWFWTDGADAFSVLQDLLASEGQPALMSIDTTGAFVFRDRHHRLIRSASLNSQATFRGTGVTEPVMGKGYVYSDNWQNVVNSVTLSLEERAASNLQVVFSTDEVINIPASSSVTVLVRASDPFMSALAPVAITDYTTLTGTIVSATLSSTSGSTTSITLTSAGLPASISNLQLRALPVPVARSYQTSSTDSTSITDYGPRSMPNEPVYSGRYDVKPIADQIVLQRKQPLPLLTVRFSCQATQTTRLARLLALDISDRVTVIETETAVNSDFFIESIEHTISSMYDHEIVFGLEAVPASPTSVFILDTTTLNSVTPLGY